MATSAQIIDVRNNAQEFREDRYDDEYITGLVDSSGVYTASAEIWRKKAAEYTELVNVSEAGATHAFGDLQVKALRMVDVFEALASEAGESPGGTGSSTSAGRAQVKVIDRS